MSEQENIRILVVDDEATVTRIFEKILTAEGYAVDTANSGQKALGMIEQARYNVLVSDVEMPGLDGVELMKKVKVALHPQADKIVATKFKAGLGPNFHDNIVEITAKGRTFSTEVSVPKGHYTRPLTDEELKEKFRNNAGYSLIRTDKIEQAIELIYDLEKLGNIKELTKMLTTE